MQARVCNEALTATFSRDKIRLKPVTSAQFVRAGIKRCKTLVLLPSKVFAGD